jgi:hypothetical protein
MLVYLVLGDRCAEGAIADVLALWHVRAETHVASPNYSFWLQNHISPYSFRPVWPVTTRSVAVNDARTRKSIQPHKAEQFATYDESGRSTSAR